MKKQMWLIKEVVRCNRKIVGMYALINISSYFLISFEPFLIQQIVKYLGQYKLKYSVIVIGILICLNCIQDITISANSIINIKIQKNISDNFYGKLYTKLNKIPLQEFDKSDFLVKLTQAKTSIESKIENTFSNIVNIIGALIGLGTTIILVSTLDKKYIILYCIMAIFQNLFIYINSVRTINLIRSQIPEKRIHNYFVDVLQRREFAKEIRLYSNFSWLENKREKVIDELEDKHIAYSRRWLCVNFIWAVTMFSLEGILYVLLLKDILKGNATIDKAILVIESCTVFIENTVSLANYININRQNSVYNKDLVDVLDNKEKFEMKIEKKKNDNIVSLEKVSFKYKEDNILKDISLNIKENETLVLVGENGSGKTTLSKIIAGLFEPSQGNIVLSTDNISAIFQDYARYKLSLRVNIGVGNFEKIYDDDCLLDILSVVQAKTILGKINKNLDIDLSREFCDNGMDLSLGEWQKIAFARGLIKDAKVVIFDEPTASLDPLAEMREFSLIKEEMENKTVVLITHRIGMINLAQRIIFMNEGKIVEFGTHEELMKKKGEYYEFYSCQAKWYK